MKDRLTSLVSNKCRYLYISALIFALFTLIVGCHFHDNSRHLLYNFDFMFENEHYALSINVSLNKDGYICPGSDFSYAPSGAIVNISYEKYGKEYKSYSKSIALTDEKTVNMLYIIGESEIFSLPNTQQGPEPYAGIGGSYATFSRTYNGKTITIKRVDGNSQPVISLINELHEFVLSLQK